MLARRGAALGAKAVVFAVVITLFSSFALLELVCFRAAFLLCSSLLARLFAFAFFASFASVYVARIPNGAKLLLIHDLFVFADTFLEE